MTTQSNQQLAEKWHWIALAIAALLFGWELYGTWGHYWLRRRSVEVSVERANRKVAEHLNRAR